MKKAINVKKNKKPELKENQSKVLNKNKSKLDKKNNKEHEILLNNVKDKKIKKPLKSFLNSKPDKKIEEKKNIKKEDLNLEIKNNQEKENDFIASKEELLNKEIKINAPKKRSNNLKDEPQLSIQAILHGALYVAGKEGMTLADFHKILPKLTTDEIRRHLLVLQNKLENDVDSGLSLNDFGGKYKLLTKMNIQKEMQRYANVKFKNPLNSKLMEVLAIIAYNQPCTRPRISEIRGIESASLVDILIDKGLVVELGRADTWGRPFIYEVSQKFFDLFGISKIEELPEIEDFNMDSFQESNFFDSNRFED